MAPAPNLATYDESGALADETWIEDLRTLDDRYASSSPGMSGPGANGRKSGAGSGLNGASGVKSTQYPEPPRPDHGHDGDTKPRHAVKIMHAVLPSQSGIIEAPQPTPKPKSSSRMSEPTPIETDDEEWYYWNGEDLVRRDEPPSGESNGAGPRDPSK